MRVARLAGTTLAGFDRLSAVERALWYAEDDLERTRCSCGHPVEVCSDPDRDWFPQRNICYATRERAAAAALWAQMHAERPYHDGTESLFSEKRTRATPYRYDEGVTLFVSEVDLNPDDQFLTPSLQGVDDVQPDERKRGDQQDA